LAGLLPRRADVDQLARLLPRWVGALFCWPVRSSAGAALVLLPGAAIGGTLCHWKDGFARFVRRLRP